MYIDITFLCSCSNFARLRWFIRVIRMSNIRIGASNYLLWRLLSQHHSCYGGHKSPSNCGDISKNNTILGNVHVSKECIYIQTNFCINRDCHVTFSTQIYHLIIPTFWIFTCDINRNWNRMYVFVSDDLFHVHSRYFRSWQTWQFKRKIERNQISPVWRNQSRINKHLPCMYEAAAAASHKQTCSMFESTEELLRTWTLRYLY